MKVILLKDVEKLGLKDEVKEVSPGYARNFLIPQGLAEIATENKIRVISAKEKKGEIDRKRKGKLKEKIFNKLKNREISLKRKATREGHLFAGLHENDIIEAIERETDIKLEKVNIILESPLKKIGLKPVKINLDENKIFNIKINIQAE